MSLELRAPTRGIVEWDELIRVSKVQNSFVGIEHLTDQELEEIREKCERRANAARRHDARIGPVPSVRVKPMGTVTAAKPGDGAGRITYGAIDDTGLVARNIVQDRGT
jgi:hypothetical protein